VIIKPSEDVPHTVTLLVEILLEAGLPPEVIQLVHGRGETVGKALVEHPRRVISFTGSTETGPRSADLRRMHKRLSLEMGGKNAIIVMDDANSTWRSKACCGAFGTTGQRCTATSRLCCTGRCTIASCAVSPSRGKLRSATAGRAAPMSAADPRGIAQEGGAVRRNRPGPGRRARHRRPAAEWREVCAGILLSAHHLCRGEGGQPPRAGGDFRAGLSVVRFNSFDERCASTTV
jgi:hypothetical protein